MRKLAGLAASLALLMVLALPGVVEAQLLPGPVLMGTVTVDGVAAADGTLVEALVGGTKIGDATTPISGGVAGSFRIEASFYEALEGQAVSFRVTPPGRPAVGAQATPPVTYARATAILNVGLAAVSPVPTSSVLAPLIAVNALNIAYSPDPSKPGKFLSFIPNVPGNSLSVLEAYQTIIINVTTAGQAIPAGLRGQPGQTTLSVGINFLTYAP